MENVKNSVESLLFASGKFMSEENLSLIIGCELKEVKRGLKELKKEYDDRGHSLMLVQEGDTWKINVREKYLDLVRKIVADTELPKQVLKTLAVIAWKNPAVQSEIIKTRGNKAYEHIAQLEEMGFVIKEKDGRSFKLRVSEKFFEYFDVEGDKSSKEMFKDVKQTVLKAESLEEQEEALEEEFEQEEEKEEEKHPETAEEELDVQEDIEEIEEEEETLEEEEKKIKKKNV